MKHVLYSTGSWIDESSLVLNWNLDSWQLFQPMWSNGIADQQEGISRVTCLDTKRTYTYILIYNFGHSLCWQRSHWRILMFWAFSNWCKTAFWVLMEKWQVKVCVCITFLLQHFTWTNLNLGWRVWNMCKKQFWREHLCALQVFLCALVSWPVKA